MKTILNKCDITDLEYLSEQLDSYFSFTNDSKRKDLLGKYRNNKDHKKELISLIDSQIKYFGSSDIAYAKRALFDGDGAIPPERLIQDVCEKLKIKIKEGGSIEAYLERVTTAVVDKELSQLSSDELRKRFHAMNIGDKEIDLFVDGLKKNGKISIVPILYQTLGPKVALSIIETVIVTLIAQIIGKQAATALVKELLKRNPWINALGPALWVASGAWLALDLQGPAFRKTIPICLYLGTVALRDGKETEE